MSGKNMNPKCPRHRRKEKGFIMIIVLALSFLLTLIIAVAVQANYLIFKQNRQELKSIQTRAANLKIKNTLQKNR